MMQQSLETCGGFYRHIIDVSSFEIWAVFAIAVALTYVVGTLSFELLQFKAVSGFWLLVAVGLMIVVLLELLLPLSRYYVEIPHHSFIDCSFNVLRYPDFYSSHFDLLFVYFRLLSLVTLPMLLVIMGLSIGARVCRTVRSSFFSA